MVSGDAAARHVTRLRCRHRCRRHRDADDADGRREVAPGHRDHPARADRVRAGDATPWRPSAAAGRDGAAAGRHCGGPAAAIGSGDSCGSINKDDNLEIGTP